MASILIIGINYSPEPTGIGKYTGELGAYLAGKGESVQVITAFPYYPQWKISAGYKYRWYQHEEIEGAAVTRCPLYVPSNPGGAKRMLQDLSFFFTSFWAVTGLLLKRKKQEIIFVASPSFMSGLLGVWYKMWRPKAKLVYHIQDLQIDAAEELGMIKQKSLLNLLKKMEGYLLRKADIVSTISEGMLERILTKKIPVRQHVLFPNWVNFRHIYRTEFKSDILAGLQIPPGKQLVFYSGAVGEKQGLEMILEAAAMAKAELPQLHFIISGSGPYALLLQQKAAEKALNNLQFIPLQPLDIFNQLLNAAWLHLVIQKDKAGDLLLPSKLSNILAVGGLAMVTASPQTSLYNIIKVHDAGYLVPPENAEALYNGIRYLAASPELATGMKRNAAVYAHRYLNQANVINQFMSDIGFPLSDKVVLAKQSAAI